MIEAMIKFMGYFLVIVAILKIIDWKKFSENFSKYDLIAKRSKTYSFSYPIIELAIGISFLNNFYVFYHLLKQSYHHSLLSPLQLL